ncbi:MAG: ATP-binding cassette domain-containing protein, partial [Actinomycetota bacterium]
MFEARGLTVRFGGHNAVTEVDLDVESGCVTGLIGPNGAGKTTIFNAITGPQDLSGGTLTLEGREITHEAPQARA